MNSTFIFFIVVAMVLVAIALISHRSGIVGHFGTFEPSNKVEKNFKRHQVPTQYHYYYYRKSPTEILALVGLDEQYTITGDAWREFDPTEEVLEQLLMQITLDYLDPPDGFILLGLDQSPMGVFYSPMTSSAMQINKQQQVTFTLDVQSTMIDGEGVDG